MSIVFVHQCKNQQQKKWKKEMKEKTGGWMPILMDIV